MDPCNSNTWEAEAGGSQVPGQPGLQSETLSHKKKQEMGVVVHACIQLLRRLRLGGCDSKSPQAQS
jgi:hypothetical protein